jgi:hypothetical protein
MSPLLQLVVGGHYVSFTLEKRLRAAADPMRANSGLTSAQYS